MTQDLPAPDILRRPSAPAETETLGDDDSSLSGQPGAVAPAWLTDLRTSKFRNGFYNSLPNHAVHFVRRSPTHLVVSFDNLSSAREDPVNRESWGYGFIRSNDWSHLGVMAFSGDWYRDEALFDYLDSLAVSGFFTAFDKVTLIGTSMGAYAACAFASLAPGCSVVAFSPQSTLRKDLVPWEKRFRSGRKADWTGRYADAAAEAGAAGTVWLVYDPWMAEDRLHAERFHTPNVRFLRARHAGHKTALFLRRAELLSTVVRAAVAGTLDEQFFYRLYRKGRALPWYIHAVADTIAASQNAARLSRALKAVIGMGRPHIARMISARFSQLLSRSTPEA